MGTRYNQQEDTNKNSISLKVYRDALEDIVEVRKKLEELACIYLEDESDRDHLEGLTEKMYDNVYSTLNTEETQLLSVQKEKIKK